jgi:tripartite-type tricarboxylate transporter receptor subunit TctC
LTRRWLLAAAGTLALAALPSAANAQEDFYKGKTVSVLFPTGAGGVNDLYMRTITKYLKEYVPGNPDFIIQSMPGAGGITLANHLFNNADQDGTVIGSLNQTVGVSQVLSDSVRYNTGEFLWIGRATPTTGLVMLHENSKAKSLEDMKTIPTVFGAQGKGSQTYLTPILMKNLLGHKINVTLGYKTSAEIFLAMERGEVQGRTGALETLLAVHPDWIEKGKMMIVGELSLEDEPSFPGVPLLPELVKDPADREVLNLIASYTAFGISMAFPPNVPSERVEIIRAAFDKVMADPRFLEEMKSLKMEVRPLSGAKLQVLAQQFKSISPDLLDRTKKALNW